MPQPADTRRQSPWLAGHWNARGKAAEVISSRRSKAGLDFMRPRNHIVINLLRHNSSGGGFRRHVLRSLYRGVQTLDLRPSPTMPRSDTHATVPAMQSVNMIKVQGCRLSTKCRFIFRELPIFTASLLACGYKQLYRRVFYISYDISSTDLPQSLHRSSVDSFVELSHNTLQGKELFVESVVTARGLWR